MAKLILTSHGLDSKEIYQEFVECVTPETKVAYVTTAKDEKENSKGPQKAKRQFLDMGIKVFDFVDIEFQNPKILLEYDLIILGGGTPFRLMYYIRKSGCEKVLKEIYNSKRVLAGISSGAMVLGKSFAVAQYFKPEQNVYNLTDFSGIGLCDLSLCSHYDTYLKKYKDLDIRLKQFEKENNINITKLNDGYAIVIEDGKKREIGGEVVEI